MSEQYPHQPYPPQQPPKKPHTFRNVVLGVLAGGLLLMGGCVALVGIAADGVDSQTSSVTETGAPTTAPTEGDAPNDSTTPPAVPETSEPEPESKVAKVGATEWHTYNDGIEVQVTKLTRFKVGQYAAGGKPGGTGVIATVTIRNKSGRTFDAELVQIKLQSGPNGDEAESVYDSDNDLSGGFSGSIANGKVKTAKAGFAVPKAHYSKITVEVAPSWDHEATFFEGAAR